MTDPQSTRASLIGRLPDAGNGAAWDEFASLYAPLIYRLARKQGLQPSDADDVAQEVMSAVARSVDDWLQRSDRGSFRAWLFRIARNTSINFLTRRKHQRLGTGGDSGQDWLENIPAESAEFDIEYRREIFRWAAAQMRQLVSAAHWNVFCETTLHSRPIAEVASEYAMSIGSVYIVRSRVMSRLRELVRRFEEQE